MTQEQTVALARDENCNKWYSHCDGIKNQLLDEIVTPQNGLIYHELKAIMDGCRCKGFGSTHLHSLLEPVTRHHLKRMCAPNLGEDEYSKVDHSGI